MRREVQECSSILSEMDGILTKYQTDLDKAVNQIHNLQVPFFSAQLMVSANLIGLLCV